MPKMNIFRSSVGKYFLILAILPIILLSVLFSLYARSIIIKVKENDTKQILNNTANSIYQLLDYATTGNMVYREVDGVVYLGDKKLSGEYSFVDNIKKSNDVDITFFEKDIRIVTTIRNVNGDRYIFTRATDIWNNYASKGKDYFDESININNNDYYAYYMPILDNDNNSIGMIFAGVPADNINATIEKMINIVVIVAVLFCLGAIILAFILYNHIISVQNEALEYIQEIDSGILNHTMNPKMLKRRDEYGMMCRYFVKLNNSLITLIQKDSLTGLNNRRAAMEKLEKYVVEANTNGGSTFCLAIGDIDFFKKVNDTYGHSCGDEVLKMVAEKLSHISQEGGFAARWGGEEFLIVIKGKRNECEKKLRKIFEEVRASSVEYDGRLVSVTMTFGLSEYIPPRKLDVLISNADILLYKGKENGRNQIVT